MVPPNPSHESNVSERVLWQRSAIEIEKFRKERLHLIFGVIIAVHIALLVFLAILLAPKFEFTMPTELYEIVPLLALPLLVLAAFVQYGLTGTSSKDRIILTPDGIMHRSARPAWVQRLWRQTWTVRWCEIESMTLKAASLPFHTGTSLEGAELVLHTPSKQHKIMPFNWIDVTDTQPTSPMTLNQQLRQGTEQQVCDLFKDTPILSYIFSLDLPFDIDTMIANLLADTAGQQAQPWSFKFDASAKTAVTVAIALAVYFGVAYMTLPDIKLVGSGMRLYMFMSEFAIAGAIFFWLKSTQTTFQERFNIVMLVWIVIEIAAYPTLLHLNRLTSLDAMQPYTYVLQEDRYLRPVYDPGLPPVKASQADLEHCPAGSTHTLYLQKGGLGLYMMDQQAVEQQIESNACP